MGIETIGELAALPLDALVRSFGVSYGQYLYEAARGIDESPLVTHWEPKSFSRETTFQIDVKDWQIIARAIAEMTKEVVSDLTRKDYKTKTVTLKLFQKSDIHSEPPEVERIFHLTTHRIYDVFTILQYC